MPRPPSFKFKVPEFDGSENVEGYLRVFEIGCQGMGMNEEQMRVNLITRLTGAAASWVQGLGDQLLYLDYGALRQQLITHFAGERSSHVRALLQLRQKGDLVTHNKAFGKGAAAAASLMSPMWVNEVYLGSLSSTELRKQLRGWSHLPLQQLLAKALDMEPDFKGSTTQYSGRPGL